VRTGRSGRAAEPSRSGSGRPAGATSGVRPVRAGCSGGHGGTRSLDRLDLRRRGARRRVSAGALAEPRGDRAVPGAAVAGVCGCPRLLGTGRTLPLVAVADLRSPRTPPSTTRHPLLFVSAAVSNSSMNPAHGAVQSARFVAERVRRNARQTGEAQQSAVVLLQRAFPSRHRHTPTPHRADPRSPRHVTDAEAPTAAGRPGPASRGGCGVRRSRAGGARRDCHDGRAAPRFPSRRGDTGRGPSAPSCGPMTGSRAAPTPRSAVRHDHPP
jgi:hypothetical protein